MRTGSRWGTELAGLPVPSPAATAAAALGIAALLGTGRVAEGPVLCPFRRVTGLPCPGCGLTRSVVATLDGRLADAVGFHPAGPLLVLVCSALVVVEIVARWKRLPASPLPAITTRLRPVVVAVAAVWLVWAPSRWV